VALLYFIMLKSDSCSFLRYLLRDFRILSLTWLWLASFDELLS
jgi:hypothetical protein